LTNDHYGRVKVQITQILPFTTAESRYVHIKPLCAYFQTGKGKGKGKFHPRTSHEVPQGE